MRNSLGRWGFGLGAGGLAGTALTALLVVTTVSAAATTCTSSGDPTYSYAGYQSQADFTGIEGVIADLPPSVTNPETAHAVAAFDMSASSFYQCKDGGFCFIQDGYGVGCIGGTGSSCTGGVETGSPEAYIEEDDLDNYYPHFYPPSTIPYSPQNFYNDFYSGYMVGDCVSNGHVQFLSYAYSNGTPVKIGAGYFPTCALGDFSAITAIEGSVVANQTCPHFPIIQAFGQDQNGDVTGFTKISLTDSFTGQGGWMQWTSGTDPGSNLQFAESGRVYPNVPSCELRR